MQHFVERGFVVLATQYRGEDGGQGEDEFGGADVEDLMNLVPLARTLPFVGEDLFFYGRSRGTMQMAMALRRGAPVKAAVSARPHGRGRHRVARPASRRPIGRRLAHAAHRRYMSALRARAAQML